LLGDDGWGQVSRKGLTHAEQRWDEYCHTGKRGVASNLIVALGLLAGLYLVGSTGAGPSPTPRGEVLAMWIELDPFAVAIARLVTTQANCPSITLGTQAG
jgi:hypothetical protein